MDLLCRQNFEERHDWSGGSWAARYDISQEYHKNGNRTRYHRNVTTGFDTSYGKPQDLTTATLPGLARRHQDRRELASVGISAGPTTAADADVATYGAAFTTDANGNVGEGPG